MMDEEYPYFLYFVPLPDFPFPCALYEYIDMIEGVDGNVFSRDM